MPKYFYVGDFTETVANLLSKEIPGDVVIRRAEILMDEMGFHYLYVNYLYDNGSNMILQKLLDDSLVETVKYVAKRINKYYESLRTIKLDS
jgi:hypothetical protein